MDNGLHGEFNLSTPDIDLPQPSDVTLPFKKTSNLHFYSSYCRNPKGITFEDQEHDEDILLLLRRHFITNLPWLLSGLFLILLPIIFPFILSVFPFPIPTSNILTLMLATYYLIIFGFLLLNFTLWYFNTGIVTNIRVIDININGILYREVAETNNEEIQDVSYAQIGFIRSLFDFGDVAVQTAGSKQNVEYDKIPKPSIVSRIIGDLSNN